MAVHALGCFLCATVAALGLGLLAGNLIKPGQGFAGGPTADGAELAKERIAEAGEAGHRRLLDLRVVEEQYEGVSLNPPLCPSCGQPASEALAGPAHGWECRNEACPEFGQGLDANEPVRDEPDPERAAGRA